MAMFEILSVSEILSKGEEQRVRGNEQNLKRYHDLIKQGICGVCRVSEVVPGKSRCQGCADLATEKRKAARSHGLCRCGRRPESNVTLCEVCRSYKRRYSRKVREEVYAAYGGFKCVCCGETEPRFLQLDHINDDGAKHRKEVGTGSAFYSWLKKNGFPPGL